MISEKNWLSASDAAKRLGVVPSRVRKLADEGQISGKLVGRQWVFEAADIDKWQDQHKAVGRPLSEASSFGLLFELSGCRASWLDSVARWKVLHSQAAKDPNLLVARSRRRAERLELRAHPSDLPRILSEQGVVRGGVSAVRDHGIGLVASELVEIYVDRTRASNLRRKYSLVESGSPNVILHVVADLPAVLREEAMPLGVVFVDLAESGEPRAVAASRRVWSRLARG